MLKIVAIVVVLLIGKTFFSPAFGMVADRFGVSWMVIVQPGKQGEAMRFMMLMIPKGYEKAAPGTMPDPKQIEQMMKYNESLQKAAAGFAEMQGKGKS